MVLTASLVCPFWMKVSRSLIMHVGFVGGGGLASLYRRLLAAWALFCLIIN